tara:strand:- start:3505 stop:3843 length:339 start_codon:yes stop_codon:yes gene_type:complete
MIEDRIPFGNHNQFIQQLALMGFEQSHILTGPKIPYRHITNEYEINKIIYSHGVQELGLTQVRILLDRNKRAGWCADILLEEQELLVRWLQGGKPMKPTSSYLPIFGGRHGK